MSDLPSPGSPSSPGRPPDDRLDSWKEIASYMRRDITTVQRWEKREGMPVHRHVHDKLGTVYAFRTDLDAWARSRNLGLIAEAFTDGRSPALRSGQKTNPGSRGRRRELQPVHGRSPRHPRAAPRRDDGWACGWRRRRSRLGRGPDGLAGSTTRRLAGESAGGCALSAADRLRRDRTGGRALPRRAIRGLSFGSRRANGRVGHPGRDGAVLQPDS